MVDAAMVAAVVAVVAAESSWEGPAEMRTGLAVAFEGGFSKCGNGRRRRAD